MKNDAITSGTLLNNIERVINYRTRQVSFPNVCPSEGAFIAIAAPSFTGKTQLAFSLVSQRPLYFAIKQHSESSIQPIYLNFESLNIKLEELAENDLKMVFNISNVTFGRSITKIDAEKKFNKRKQYFQAISVSNLNGKKFYNAKFQVLGFIRALMKEAKEKYDGSVEWMRFHADRSAPDRQLLAFSSCSFSEIEKDPEIQLLKEQYFVFLDEFVGLFWSVLIRNICRRVKLQCSLASTNSKITNLTGFDSVKASRVRSPFIWSIAITKLPTLEYKVLEAKLSKLKNSSLFIARSKRGETIPFFSYIQKNILKIRPGIAVLIADYINNCSTDKAKFLDMSSFFSNLLLHIYSEISVRKQSIGESLAGQMGTFALFSGRPLNYPVNSTIEYTKIYNSPVYLNDHLYFLHNPLDEKSFIFPLYNPCTVTVREIKVTTRNRIIAKEKSETHLRVRLSSSAAFQPWSPLTYFDFDEELLSLSFISKSFDSSCAKSMLNGKIGLSIPDPTIGTKESGYFAELRAVSSIIDATHHSMIKNDKVLLNGVGGFTFFYNLIYNMIVDHPSSLQLHFSPEIAPFIESLHFPFLYAANIPISQDLKSVFPGVFDESLFTHTHEVATVDGHFSYFDKGKKKNLVVEVKDKSVPTGVSEFIAIAKKGKKDPFNCDIHILFTNSLAGYKYDVGRSAEEIQNLKDLSALVEEEGDNLAVYRLQFDNSKCNIVPFKDLDEFKYNPTKTKRIFFVLEYFELNRPIKF